MDLIKTIVIKSSLNCNLRCNYCYEFRRNEVDVRKQISIDKIEDLMKRFAILFPKSHILWMLHGGEPFINGVDYYERFCQIMKQLNKDYDVEFKTAIQTNATLLNERWIDVIEKYNDLLSERILSISIDGPKNINDKSRITKNGDSTFDTMMSVFAMLKKTDLKYTTISVVGAHNKDDWKSVYDFIKSIEPTFSKFIPCYNYDSNGRLEKPMDYAWFMTNMFDMWINDSESNLFIDPILTIIRKLSGKTSQWCEYREDKCEHFISIYPNGDLWLCDTYNQDTMKKYALLGNVFSMNDRELTALLTGPTTQCDYDALYHNLNSKCQNCEYYKYCTGGCIPTRFDLMSKSNVLYNEYCQGRKFLINHIKNAVDQIAK